MFSPTSSLRPLEMSRQNLLNNSAMHYQILLKFGKPCD